MTPDEVTPAIGQRWQTKDGVYVWIRSIDSEGRFNLVYEAPLTNGYFERWTYGAYVDLEVLRDHFTFAPEEPAK
jgi:hypothetical protein